MSTAPRAVVPPEEPVCPADIPTPGWARSFSHASESVKNPLTSEHEEEETDSEDVVVEERPEEPTAAAETVGSRGAVPGEGPSLRSPLPAGVVRPPSESDTAA
eukprot:5196921-Pyramimonas_sp.AAC.1